MSVRAIQTTDDYSDNLSSGDKFQRCRHSELPVPMTKRQEMIHMLSEVQPDLGD